MNKYVPIPCQNIMCRKVIVSIFRRLLIEPSLITCMRRPEFAVYRGSMVYWPRFLIMNGEIEYISIIMNNWCFFPYSINYFLFQSLTIVEIIFFLINWNCWCVVASLNVFKSDVICILLHAWCVALLIREDYKPENDLYFSKNGGLDYHWIKNNVLSLIWIGKK